jgi:hypothetical protein
MSETDNEPLELAVDPPDSGGGTQGTLDSPQKPVPVDPPDGGGGTDG